MPDESNVLTADVTVQVLVVLARSYCVTVYVSTQIQRDFTVVSLA